MRLSLSVRVAEGPGAKREAALSLESPAESAASSGYKALCMRASQLEIQIPLDRVRRKRDQLSRAGLAVSMVTGDFPNQVLSR